jgi:hypothetical protein
MHRNTFLGLIPLALLGCTGGIEEFSTAKASGKVLCDGKPVPFVRVTFAPMGEKKNQVNVGKAGLGEADADGVFIVSTYGEGDGAVVGKHSIVVAPPHPEKIPEFFCDCETNGAKPVMEVDVSAGAENSFTINLPQKKSKSAPNFSADDVNDAREASRLETARRNGH